MVYLNIESLLKKNNKSVYWLVQNLNSNYTQVNKMINNETQSIEFRTISKLLDIFDCTIEELLTTEQKR